jgi:hypothetical protein
VWSWCVEGRGGRGAEVEAIFTPEGRVGVVVSTARGHRAGGSGTGGSAERLPDGTQRAGPGLRVLRIGGGGTSAVYGVRRGRVRYTAVASSDVAASPSRLRRYLRLAGLR